MGIERADIIERQKTYIELFDHLYKKFDRCGKKDFNFIVKNLAKELHWDPYKVLAASRRFMEYGLVQIINERATRDMWRTKFENKNKEELLNAII